ncbi:MAG TPA: hypothetical protein VGD62_08000 [Acidobacteriaceae bacterium]
MPLLAQYAVYLVEGIFFCGLVGSSVVVAISFVEDLHELLGED